MSIQLTTDLPMPDDISWSNFFTSNGFTVTAAFRVSPTCWKFTVPNSPDCVNMLFSAMTAKSAFMQAFDGSDGGEHECNEITSVKYRADDGME
jgi:hypothetical protein